MSLLQQKEFSSVAPTALLAELFLEDGSIRRFASAKCSEGGIDYEARIHPELGHNWKLTSDISSETSGLVSVILADDDAVVAQLFQTGKLAGARIRLSAAILEGREVVSKTALLAGLLDNLSEINGKTARLNVLSRLSAVRASFPPMRIQKQCSWAFPKDFAQRELASSSGEDGRYSPMFRCGYSPDIPGGSGNLINGEPYTSCDFTRVNCEQRGMFDRDESDNPTHRFSGIEFVPPSIVVRGHGESSGRISNLVSIETRFNDVVPAVYGQGWLQAPVVFARNDGNLTRCEVLLGLGEIHKVIKVVADGYEIPEASDQESMTGTGWYNVVSAGNRNGSLNAGFADGNGKPVGDPYGSMAYLNLVLPNRINDGKRSPRVEVLMQGLKLPVLDAEGTLTAYEWSTNPAWILCDILRRTGWKLDELALDTFVQAASYCAEEIDAYDANGVLRQVPRFESNLILRRKYSVSELIRSFRIGAMLFVYFRSDGKLALRPESSIANEQADLPAGSNAISAISNGWPSYEFGDGSLNRDGIVLNSRMEAEFRVYSKSSQDSPNRVFFEIQDSLNEFRQDSISIADTEDIRLRRQEISQAVPVVGVPNFPQAQRICQTWLNKSIGGNVYVEFRTSIRGIHLRPGDLITISHSRYGFDRTLFRILEFQISPRLDSMKVICQLHQDHWYSDDALVRYDRSRIYSWRSASARAVCGTLLEDGEIRFDAGESLVTNDAGFQQVRLRIPFRRPSKEVGMGGGVPLVSFRYSVQQGAGSLGPGVYYYGLTTSDSEGNESGLSSLIPVNVAGSLENNQVTLEGVSVASGAVSMNLYRGKSPYQLHRIATAIGVSSTVVDSGFQSLPILAPDPNYTMLRAWVRQNFLVDQTPSGWSSTSISRSDGNFSPDKWIGKIVVIRQGTGAGQERPISGNTSETISIDRPWTILPDASSRFAIVEANWTMGAESEGDLVDLLLSVLPASSFEISLRSVSKDGSELDALESPLLIWQIGVGGTGSVDFDTPPQPNFSLGLLENGIISLGGLSFASLENVASVYMGQLRLLYWDELDSPTPLSLATAVNEVESDWQIAGLQSPLVAGSFLQVGEEIVEVLGFDALGGSYQMRRGTYQSPLSVHDVGQPLFQLQHRDLAIPFVPGYFQSSSAVGFRHNVAIPNIRIAAAGLVLYNRLGASPDRELSFTGLFGGGLRTMSGGQISLNVNGYIAIEAAAGTSHVVDRSTVVREIQAFVQQPPQGANIVLVLRVDDVPYAEVTIEDGSHASQSITGFNRGPLTAGSVVSLDVVSVPSGVDGIPGKDLTVQILV